jgi:hypothetical protein
VLAFEPQTGHSPPGPCKLFSQLLLPASKEEHCETLTQTPLLVQLSGHGGGVKGDGALHATKVFWQGSVLGKHCPCFKTSVLSIEIFGHQIQFNCKARLIERHVVQLIVELTDVKFVQVGGGFVTGVEQVIPEKSGTQTQVLFMQFPFPLQNDPLLKQGGVKTEQLAPE